MVVENFSKQYKLNGTSIDEMSEKVDFFLNSIKLEKSNIIRARLSVEEALLRWQDHFGDEVTVDFDCGLRLTRPTIRISLQDEPYDPLSASESDLGMWANSLLSSVGLDPVYSYQKNTNIVTLRFPKPKSEPAKLLLISIAIGLAVGISTLEFLPESFLTYVADSLLDPVQEMFFRILNVAAIPIIFLDVLSATCGAGTMAGGGKENRRFLKHFLVLSTLITAVGAICAVPLFGIKIEALGQGQEFFKALIASISGIIPNDVMTPFQTGEVPQLIFLAVVLGNALLIAGHQASGLTRLVDECHKVILLVADWVSWITPVFVVILLVLGVWDGSLWRVLALWEPVVLFGAISVAVLMLFIVWLSIKKKVGISVFISKIKKPFKVAFRNSSVNSAYGLSQKCCVRQLGMSKGFFDNTYPLGLVLFMPTATMAILLFTLYSAHVYNVQITMVWVVLAVLLAVTLQTASPPVAGVNLLAYAAIFARMGIPDDALILAMVADILFCFLASAMDQTLLQIVMIFQADRTGQLNQDILQQQN